MMAKKEDSAPLKNGTSHDDVQGRDPRKLKKALKKKRTKQNRQQQQKDPLACAKDGSRTASDTSPASADPATAIINGEVYVVEYVGAAPEDEQLGRFFDDAFRKLQPPRLDDDDGNGGVNERGVPDTAHDEGRMKGEEKAREVGRDGIDGKDGNLDDEDEDGEGEHHSSSTMSKRQRKLASRPTVLQLKRLVERPEVVEIWDPTAPDPELLVHVKSLRNAIPVPRHWCQKRRYMQGKRGIEKSQYALPEWLEFTGIARIREAILEREASKSARQKAREKVRPKASSKINIDYQALQTAFFKLATKDKPRMSPYGDMYFEGKEFEAKMRHFKPGKISEKLKTALNMVEGGPPPWLISMQRYGPPPAYPKFKIPGLNAPIPAGASYGYHPGGWGKPPTDEFGNPVYGDFLTEQPSSQPTVEMPLWGELQAVGDFPDEGEDEGDEEEGDEEGQEGQSDDAYSTEQVRISRLPPGGTVTPSSGMATPSLLGGTRSITSGSGTRSESGFSSLTSSFQTPHSLDLRRSGIASIGPSQPLNPNASTASDGRPYVVLQRTEASGPESGLFGVSHKYHIPSSGGIATPLGGGGGTTPLALGGIATPMRLGMETPSGLGPSVGADEEGVESSTDLIRQQLRAEAAKDAAAKRAAGLIDPEEAKRRRLDGTESSASSVASSSVPSATGASSTGGGERRKKKKDTFKF